MLIRKSRLPMAQMLTVGLLPSPLKVLLYRLLGYRIGRGVAIGALSVVMGREVEIGEGTRIGFATILRGRSMRIGKRVRVGSMVFFDVRAFEIGDDAKINEQVYAGGPMLPESFLRLGERTIVMQLSFLNPTKPLIIGDDTGIGGHCLLFTHGSWQPQTEGYPVTFAPITLGNNVWLPWRVFVMPGVKIGDGATIGAGSLVNKDVPPGCLAAGIPAKVLRGPEDYPPRPTSESQDEMLRSMFREFRAYLEDEGFEVSERPNESGFLMRITRRGRESGVIRYSRNFDPDRARQEGPHSLFSLGVVSEEAARPLAAEGKMVVDLGARKRWGSTAAGEEAAQFLARYGLRFARGD